MSIERVSSLGVTLGGGFLVGILIGYALKKVVKLASVVVGLFFAGIAYLHYQQILSINWTNLMVVSQNTVTTLANATTQIPGFNSTEHTAALAVTNFGIPLTGSMSMGFAVGFIKG
jgi:uncharacterized membrane protein (Fun14 family)